MYVKKSFLRYTGNIYQAVCLLLLRVVEFGLKSLKGNIYFAQLEFFHIFLFVIKN